MKIGLVVLALIVCQIACGSLEDKSKAAEEHYNRGMALIKQGDDDARARDSAVTEFREAVRLKPDDARNHYMLGTALAFTHKVEPDSVIAECREAIRLKPGYAEAHACIGSMLGVKGDEDSALREYREAIRLKPELDEAHDGLIWVLEKKGDKEGAFVEKLRRDERQGDALYAQVDYDGAIAKYHLAIIAYYDAIRHYPEAKDLIQVGAMAHDKLGMALDKKGDLDGAIREYHEALKLNPKDADTYSNLAAALERNGDREGALREKNNAAEVRLGHEPTLPPPPPPPPPPGR